MVDACQNAILSWIKRFMGSFLASLIEEYDYLIYGIGRVWSVLLDKWLFKRSDHINPHKKSHGVASRLPLLAKYIDHG